MSGVLTAGVSLANIHVEAFHFAFNLASAITAADVGKAVAIDTSTARTVKLAGDGDVILGRLETVEDRTVEGIKIGTVALKGALKVPYKTGETMALGGMVVGAGSGEVKPLAAVTVNEGGSATVTVPVSAPVNRVVAIDTTAKTVEVLFI